MTDDPVEPPLTVFLVAGEESGDQLGAALMQALSERLGGRANFLGVGGERMASQGLSSLFPMEEIGLQGVVARRSNRSCCPSRTSLSRSTARRSALVWRKRSGNRSHRSPISTTFCRRCGPIAQVAREKWRGLLITSWRSRRSNRTSRANSVGLRVPTSGIPS